MCTQCQAVRASWRKPRTRRKSNSTLKKNWTKLTSAFATPTSRGTAVSLRLDLCHSKRVYLAFIHLIKPIVHSNLLSGKASFRSQISTWMTTWRLSCSWAGLRGRSTTTSCCGALIHRNLTRGTCKDLTINKHLRRRRKSTLHSLMISIARLARARYSDFIQLIKSNI